MSDNTGSVSVEVVPDARGWAEKLRAQVHDAVVKVLLDTTEADTKLDYLTGRLDRLGLRSPNVRVDADTAGAEAQLAALDATADVVARNRHLNFGAGLGSFVSDLSLLPALAMSAGSALVPLAAVIGGLALTLGAPIAIAAGGGTLFAFLAGFAVKGAMAQQKNIDALSKKVTAAQQSLERATTKSGKKTAQERLAEATTQYRQALDKVGPAQSKFIKALDGLKSAFSGMPKGALLAPLTAGLELVTKLLPAIAPILKTVSGALSQLLGGVTKSVSGGGLKHLIDAFDKQLGPDIVAFGKIAGNVLKGLGSMFLTTGAQLSGGLLDGLVKLSAKFATFGQSHAFQAFLDYVRQQGPIVGHMLAELGIALGHIIVAAAPIGTVVVMILGKLAEAIASIPIPVLMAIVAGIAAIGAAALVDELANPVTAVLALAAALSYAWKHSETFRDVVTSVFHAISAVVTVWWNKIMRPQLIALGAALGVLMLVWGKLLSALGRIPGGEFKWAKTAGAAMQDAADKALHLGRYIKAIPTNTRVTVALAGVEGSKAAISELQARLNALHNKKVWVTVAVNGAAHAAAVQANLAARAAGGPVSKNKVYLVGERGPELFSPSSAGRITPHAATQQMLAQTFATPPRPNYKAAANSGPGKYMGSATVSIGDMPFEGYVHAIIDDHLADRAAMGMS